MKTLALIVAGGTGTRMGASMPKQFILLRGKPILVHTLEKFWGFDPGMEISLVLHASTVATWAEIAEEFLSEGQRSRVHVCTGGAERTDSVCNGLEVLAKLAEKRGWSEATVAIHDAVRPFISDSILKAAYGLAAEKGSAVVSVPVKSSMRRKVGEGSVAIDRSEYYHVQTPQVFRLQEIYHIYLNRPEGKFTDDASLAEAMGMDIQLCLGSYDNIKITTPEDLAVAERILG